MLRLLGLLTVLAVLWLAAHPEHLDPAKTAIDRIVAFVSHAIDTRENGSPAPAIPGATPRFPWQPSVVSRDPGLPRPGHGFQRLIEEGIVDET